MSNTRLDALMQYADALLGDVDQQRQEQVPQGKVLEGMFHALSFIALAEIANQLDTLNERLDKRRGE